MMNLNVLTNRRTFATPATLSTLQRFGNCCNVACLADRLQTVSSKKPRNVFDDLPSLRAPPRKEHRDELARYLSTDPEGVDDVLMWWKEHSVMYPRLSRMALDYLMIPGMSRSFHAFSNVYSCSL